MEGVEVEAVENGGIACRDERYNACGHAYKHSDCAYCHHTRYESDEGEYALADNRQYGGEEVAVVFHRRGCDARCLDYGATYIVDVYGRSFHL